MPKKNTFYMLEQNLVTLTLVQVLVTMIVHLNGNLRSVNKTVKPEAVVKVPMKENANRHIIDSCSCHKPMLGNFQDLRRKSFPC